MAKNVKTIETREDLNELMAEDGGSAIIDFWAGWCGPCMAMGPHFEAAADEYADQPITFAKINTEHHPDLASSFNIRSLPTIVMVHNGEILDLSIGSQNAKAIAKKADWVMSKARGEGFLDRLIGRRKDSDA